MLIGNSDIKDESSFLVAIKSSRVLIRSSSEICLVPAGIFFYALSYARCCSNVSASFLYV